jgi:RecA/RadA recombinase
MAKAKPLQTSQKKAKESKDFNFSNISSLIDTISKKDIISVEDFDKEKTFISTGIHVLDGLLSKSILKGGIPNNKITIIAGPKQTGKSFISLNIARNAQKMGYNIIWIDTEYSIEKTDFDMYGIDTSDPDKFMLIRTNIVEKIKMFMMSFLDALQKLKDSGVDVSKTIFFIDSIGMLSSEKEKEDTLKFASKQDMTRAKQIKSLVRLITNDLGYLNIPLVATNHVYLTQDMFPQTIMSGGEGLYYASSVILLLSDAKLKTGEEDEMDLGRSGSIITAKSAKNRLAKPKKVKFEIDYSKGINPYKGLNLFCTAENFDKVGVGQVKKVINKESGEVTYQPSNRWYVKHLDKTLSEKQLFNRKVFTTEVLKNMEPIIYDYFKYPSYDECLKELEDIDEKLNEMEEKDILSSEEFNLEDDSKLFD